MSEAIKNVNDLEIGKLYFCNLNHLIIPGDNLKNEYAITKFIIKNFDYNRYLVTILKYMGNGLFCEYYTHKYVLAIENDSKIKYFVHPNMLCMVNVVDNIFPLNDLGTHYIFDQEADQTIITEILYTLFKLAQSKTQDILKEAWNEALLEDSARTRLRQLKEIPVFEKK